MDCEADYLWNLGDLKHEPIRPARPNHIGEEVYSQAWKLLMARRDDGDPPNIALVSILLDMIDLLKQRHASVAASFICWLGTNVGSSLLRECRIAADNDPGHSAAKHYLACWAWQNRRQIGRNNQVRTIEHLLAPEDHFGPALTGHTLIKWPDVTAEDYEVLDNVVVWLSSEKGQKFLATCEAEIKKRQDKEWLEQKLANNATAPA